jgi:putative addiction module component (TIGR02574 family)
MKPTSSITLRPIPRYNLSMAHTFEEIRQIAHELPEEQRILLAQFLYESVDPETGDGSSDEEIDASWKAEVERRVADIQSGAAKTVSWEELRDELEARIASRS